MADARCGPFGVVAAAFLGGGRPSRFRLTQFPFVTASGLFRAVRGWSELFRVARTLPPPLSRPSTVVGRVRGQLRDGPPRRQKFPELSALSPQPSPAALKPVVQDNGSQNLRINRQFGPFEYENYASISLSVMTPKRDARSALTRRLPAYLSVFG